MSAEQLRNELLRRIDGGWPVFLEVVASVSYWEDAVVNGVEDVEGKLIPLRAEHLWRPTIRLADGQVLGWPQGTTAKVHYKVCDEGEYWLIDADLQRVAKWRGHYVPDDFLCHGDRGYGDYIILEIGDDGLIAGWKNPEIKSEDWEVIRG